MYSIAPGHEFPILKPESLVEIILNHSDLLIKIIKKNFSLPGTFFALPCLGISQARRMRERQGLGSEDYSRKERMQGPRSLLRSGIRQLISETPHQDSFYLAKSWGIMVSPKRTDDDDERE